MSWKKNVFSYLLWVFYAVVAEAGLVCLADVTCDLLGVDIRRGTVVCALYIGAAGLAVALIHYFAPKYPGADGNRHPVRTAVETAVMVILLATGIVLRAREIYAAGAVIMGEGSEYYLNALMVNQGELPQAAGGIVYVYMRMLHGLFFFLGNKPAAAVWAQVLLQMGGLALLYLALRRLSGNIAALVTLAFGVLSSYFIREALILSPAMLYFFFWAAVLLLISIAARTKKSLIVFCAAGFMAACAGYLDATGSLLLLIAAAVIFCEEESGTARGRKPVCLLSCFAGAAAGFLVLGIADSGMSGQSLGEVMKALLTRYTSEGLRMPFSTAPAEALTEYIILFGILVLGVFSFWRNRQSDHMKAWIVMFGILAIAGCSGVLTEEIPMGIYMYLLLAVMAGIAMEECIRTVPAAEAAAVDQASVEEPPKPEEEKESKVEQESKVGQGPKEEQEPKGTQNPVQLIENPLPLPKKHVPKKMDYGMAVSAGQDDFDYEVDDGDDFDI